MDTYRASGAGGQHVNKTESAIRITHMPTGIIVACQTDRSQHRNRAIAMEMLKARLYEAELQRREAVSAAQEDAKTEIGWGHQIRNYVLAPYQLVKDLRTGVEKGNPDAVLDGDLDAFMAAALAARVRRDAQRGECVGAVRAGPAPYQSALAQLLDSQGRVHFRPGIRMFWRNLVRLGGASARQEMSHKVQGRSEAFTKREICCRGSMARTGDGTSFVTLDLSFLQLCETMLCCGSDDQAGGEHAGQCRGAWAVALAAVRRAALFVHPV